MTVREQLLDQCAVSAGHAGVAEVGQGVRADVRADLIDRHLVGDELLVRSITGVTELLTTDGMVNLDFEDLKAVINSGSGVAMIGLGAASGPGRAEAATLEALHSPLLDLDVSDARGALINVVGGSSLTLGEAEKCAQLIQSKVGENARIIWGAAVDENLGEDIRVMLVLTGVRSDQIHGASENRQLRALKSRNIEFVN